MLFRSLRLSKELSEWSRKGVRRKVKEWQQLAGWINWVLNVLPLLRPSLNNIYAKLKGKDLGARVWSNTVIREDLEWAQMKVDESDGVHLLKSVTWEVSEATCIVKTDACPEDIAFWYLNSNLGFWLPLLDTHQLLRSFSMKLLRSYRLSMMPVIGSLPEARSSFLLTTQLPSRCSILSGHFLIQLYS